MVLLSKLLTGVAAGAAVYCCFQHYVVASAVLTAAAVINLANVIDGISQQKCK